MLARSAVISHQPLEFTIIDLGVAIVLNEKLKLISEGYY